MASGQSSLARHYDKLVALVCVLLLGGAAFVFVSSQGGADAARRDCQRAIDSLKPEVEVMDTAETATRLGVFSNALASVSAPFQLVMPKEVKTGFFIPETRAWCVACRSPIPVQAVKCPVCGAEQPSKKVLAEDPRLDSDRDGMTDAWENKYGLNPLDPADAERDADGDGFTNLEEFTASTDPIDSKSHPDKINYLRVVSIDVTKLPVTFMNTITLPGNAYKCSFNYYDRELKHTQTIMIKVGDVLGPLDRLPGQPISAPKRYADFKLVDLQWVEGGFTNRFGKAEAAPVAILERVSTGRKISFRKEAEVTDNDYSIVFSQPRDGMEYAAEGAEGEAEVEIDGTTFKIKSVDKKSRNVVLLRTSDNKEFPVGPNGVVAGRK